MLTVRKQISFYLLGMLLLGGFLSAEETDAAFRRTRHKAALIALLCHNPVPARRKDFLCQASCLTALCRMFVQEGGYYIARVPQILSIRDPETAHIGLLLRELDGAMPASAAPRTLQMTAAVALAYTVPAPGGIYAAVHAGRLVETDPNNDAIARAAYSLLVSIIGGQNDDKDQLLKIAAANADDEIVAREIRALRLRDWRKLPDERSGLGRFCRAVHVWLRAKNWADGEHLGRQLLRYTESRRFLAVLTAAWFDLHGLPEELIWESLNNREIRDLCTDLYQLAAGGVLINIEEKSLRKIPDAHERTVVTQGDNPAGRDEIAPAAPQMPAFPAAPGKTAYPAFPAAPLLPAASDRRAPSPETPRPAAMPAAAVIPPADSWAASFPVN